MNKDEFQKKYHNYMVESKAVAEQEAIEVNRVTEGFKVEVAGPMLNKYCLMLESAARTANLLLLIAREQ